MTCNFRVGQKVVCVDDQWHDENWAGFPCPLNVGKVYTIKKIGASEKTVFMGKKGYPSLTLHEVDHPYGDFAGFAHDRFRPVVERKTDISIFKALLTPSKEKVETAS